MPTNGICTTSSCPRKMTHTNSMGLWYTNGSPYLGPKTRPYNNQPKKKKEENLQICSPVWPQNKTKESEKKDKYLDLAKNWKNYGTWRWQLYNCDWCFGTVIKGLLKGLKDLEVGGRVRHPNNSILKLARLPDKSPGDLRRLAVTQSPMKDISVSWWEKL